MKKKVIIGMSGGVDSAVSAYLLKKAGYEVHGLFMRNWDSTINNDFLGNPDLVNRDVCPQEQDYQDAKIACDKLGITLHRVDFIKEYWNQVFTHFLDGYKKGRTPNPDILCNKHIKFDQFAKYAIKELGADLIAMGHYAKVIHNDHESILLRGEDNNKDQSYFLAEVSQQQLQKTLFPIGELTKSEVREIARSLKLNVANKKDSTGICFIGERDFKNFLKNYIPAQPGITVDIETKKQIGMHDGVFYYTIGQRRGINLGGQKKAYYVCNKNVKKNILYVAPVTKPGYIENKRLWVSNFNWIPKEKPMNKFDCTAKFRYRQKDINVTAEFLKNGMLEIIGLQPIKSLTLGQEAVLYLNDVCLGGGVIEKIFKN